MKLTTLLLSALVLGTSVFAQYPGMMTTQVSSNPEGTALGANETLTASGIALGNRVKMRGYIDFRFGYRDIENDDQTEKFDTSADVDFLIDLSPVTAEVHLNVKDGGNDLLEQAFGRYAINDVFNISFGRQLTVLSFEGDESTELYSVSKAYLFDQMINDGYINDIYTDLGLPFLPGAGNVKARRNYKDGVRANFNNGQFGFTFGLHDGYWVDDDFNGDNIAIDFAASVMIMPGLEARLGFAHEEVHQWEDDISQFNAWIAYNPNDLTLAFEFDTTDIGPVEYWDLMLLGNYQFTDFFAATLRYSHEDLELLTFDSNADRFTLALLFSITENFGMNVEYSHSEVDSNIGNFDVDEFYIQGLISY